MDKTLLHQLFKDQLEFQTTMIRDGTYPGATHEERTARTKEMVLHMFSEADELLRASGAWKFHRNVSVRENREHVKIELIDMFKYWMIVALIQGITPEELVEAYWTKSMVVRQRYTEEWIRTTYEPSVLVDIDNVLADYIAGFLVWAHTQGYIQTKNFDRLRIIRPAYLYAQTMDIDEGLYTEMKHEFRVSQQHRLLPAMPGARDFLSEIRCLGYQIILLTSRPIHRYPNLYGDTLHWLKLRDLSYDFIWWAQDKGAEAVERLPVNSIMFAVDDEPQFVDQLNSRGIMTFWFRPTCPDDQLDQEHGEVNKLRDIPDLYRTYGDAHVSGFRTPTARPAHTRDTGE